MHHVSPTSCYDMVHNIVNSIRVMTVTMRDHIDGLVQERRNSSALAMELRISCTNPPIYHLSNFELRMPGGELRGYVHFVENWLYHNRPHCWIGRERHWHYFITTMGDDDMTWKLFLHSLCEGNPPVTSGSPPLMRIWTNGSTAEWFETPWYSSNNTVILSLIPPMIIKLTAWQLSKFSDISLHFFIHMFPPSTKPCSQH